MSLFKTKDSRENFDPFPLELKTSVAFSPHLLKLDVDLKYKTCFQKSNNLVLNLVLRVLVSTGRLNCTDWPPEISNKSE